MFLKKFLRPLTIVSISLTCAISFVPDKALADTEPESSVWFMSLSRFRIDDRFQSFLDIQPRTAIESATSRADGDLRQLLVRGALGYNIAEDVTLFQGYATIADYEPARVEHRSFQELLAKTTISDSTLVHRIRFEQRFLEGVSGVSLRGRYFLRFKKPITEELSFVSNQEAFFHLNDRDSGPQSGFDQNRFFIGVNQKIAEGFSIDLGYQNQYIERRRGASDSVNNILFVGFLTAF